MSFDVDTQTLNDLGIFQNAYNRNSVFNLFDNTKTIGGKEKLEDIFNRPLTSASLIKERLEVIDYFQNSTFQLTADKRSCDFIEFYLKKPYQNQIRPFAKITRFIQMAMYTFNRKNDYYIIEQGVRNILNILGVLMSVAQNNHESAPALLKNLHTSILKTFEEENFHFVKPLINKKKLTIIDLAKADHLFRHTGYTRIKGLLDIIYQLDLYVAVALSGKAMGFSLPIIKEDEGTSLVVKDLFHPFINNPVCNDIEFNHHKNVCFVTGTNMAGKSTFLKALGISVYLSQLGFPVPAAYMETSVFKGLITTINLADDLDKGHSHFYNEVLRVKHVAQKMNETPDIFVIFDELFRGTNVKDAYDASLAIISAFSKVRKCLFVVSTHIVEVAHDLKNIRNINFRYMETLFDKNGPIYNYRLKEGITKERLGMWIVKNEGILEMIESSITSGNTITESDSSKSN